jgi:RNA polymerase sigma factor (sigma-70 family)
MDRSVHELRDAFFQLLDRGESAELPLWQEVWRLFVNHPWYQTELHRAAIRVLRRQQAPARWAEDIAEDALLVFAKDLQNAPDLHVDRAQPEERFSGFLATVITRDCQKALRSKRRNERRAGYSNLAVETAVSPIAPLDDLIDLRSAIKDLPPDCRAVVELYWHGWHIEQIAEKLTLSQTSVHRALHRGLSLLGRRDESQTN